MKLRSSSRVPPRFETEEEHELAFLNAATSIVDLELRQRELDHAKRRRPN